MNYNVSFKARLSKKQQWEYNKLDKEQQIQYLVSFSMPSKFHTKYYNTSFNECVSCVLTDIRQRNKINYDVLKYGMMNYLKGKLQRERYQDFMRGNYVRAR